MAGRVSLVIFFSAIERFAFSGIEQQFIQSIQEKKKRLLNGQSFPERFQTINKQTDKDPTGRNKNKLVLLNRQSTRIEILFRSNEQVSSIELPVYSSQL